MIRLFFHMKIFCYYMYKKSCTLFWWNCRWFYGVERIVKTYLYLLETNRNISSTCCCWRIYLYAKSCSWYYYHWRIGRDASYASYIQPSSHIQSSKGRMWSVPAVTMPIGIIVINYSLIQNWCYPICETKQSTLWTTITFSWLYHSRSMRLWSYCTIHKK